MRGLRADHRAGRKRVIARRSHHFIKVGRMAVVNAVSSIEVETAARCGSRCQFLWVFLTILSIPRTRTRGTKPQGEGFEIPARVFSIGAIQGGKNSSRGGDGSTVWGGESRSSLPIPGDPWLPSSRFLVRSLKPPSPPGSYVIGAAGGNLDPAPKSNTRGLIGP